MIELKNEIFKLIIEQYGNISQILYRNFNIGIAEMEFIQEYKNEKTVLAMEETLRRILKDIECEIYNTYVNHAVDGHFDELFGEVKISYYMWAKKNDFLYNKQNNLEKRILASVLQFSEWCLENIDENIEEEIKRIPKEGFKNLKYIKEDSKKEFKEQLNKVKETFKKNKEKEPRIYSLFSSGIVKQFIVNVLSDKSIKNKWAIPLVAERLSELNVFLLREPPYVEPFTYSKIEERLMKSIEPYLANLGVEYGKVDKIEKKEEDTNEIYETLFEFANWLIEEIIRFKYTDEFPIFAERYNERRYKNNWIGYVCFVEYVFNKKELPKRIGKCKNAIEKYIHKKNSAGIFNSDSFQEEIIVTLRRKFDDDDGPTEAALLSVVVDDLILMSSIVSENAISE
jgi:hypothetical protein